MAFGYRALKRGENQMWFKKRLLRMVVATLKSCAGEVSAAGWGRLQIILKGNSNGIGSYCHRYT